MRRMIMIALLSAPYAPPAFAAPPLQPGLYDISMQFVLKGMPIQLPVTRFQQCVTAQDVANGMAYASSENKDCTIRNLNQSGDQVVYEFNCASQQGGPRMIGRARGTSHATGYDVMMEGRFDPAIEGMREFSQKLNARRLGDCK